ncbi:MAG: hypothetical protein HYT42_00205 [Candidatus Sungbacteria bacterium]|nr:hypothetical protein [Candidatus Sungbacteria bacterium]
MEKVVIATMTFYKSMQEMRAGLALRTAKEAQKYDYPLIVVDGGSAPEFIGAMGAFGAVIHPQKEKGLGPAHRQLFTLAAEAAGENGLVDWVEAEKWPLIAELHKINRPILDGEADLVMPVRTEEAWASYPPTQMHQEKFCNLVMKSMFPAIDADWFWGPFAANRRALLHFEIYQGEGYNGRSVPKIYAIAAGCRMQGVEVSYLHPPEQTQEEFGNLFYDLRRVKQVEQVAAMAAAARGLGLIRP